MRYLVYAALVTALLGTCGLALGLSAADAVEQAVKQRGKLTRDQRPRLTRL
jgi:hypothetical protein